MPNPYLAAALREQQKRRKAIEKVAPTASGDTPAKAAKSAEQSDNPPSKES